MPLPPRRSALRIIGIMALVFAIVSLCALVSDVTRDDIAAYHNGLDASRYIEAEVGSFYEVSSEGVTGPLCEGAKGFESKLSTSQKSITLKNKLGETVPIITGTLQKLFNSGDGTQSANAHYVEWRIYEHAVSLEQLAAFVRHIMNDQNQTCGNTIDKRTQNRDVRICPVQRVWKNESGETVTIFFDTMAINGCRGAEGNCASDCPRYEKGQFWTMIKLGLDLLEADVKDFKHVDDDSS